MEAEAMNDILNSLTNAAIDECKERQFRVITRPVLYFDFLSTTFEAQILMDLYVIRESVHQEQSAMQCIKLFDRIFGGYWIETQWCLSSIAWLPSLCEMYLSPGAVSDMQFNGVDISNELYDWLQKLPSIQTNHLMLLVSALISSLYATVDEWLIDHFTDETMKNFMQSLNICDVHEYNALVSMQRFLLPRDSRVKQLHKYFNTQSPLGKILIQRIKNVALNESQNWFTILIAGLVVSIPSSQS